MLRRLIQAGAILAVFSGPALAQSSLGVPLKPEQPLTQEEIDKQKAADRAYEQAVNKIPDKKSSSDPWGTIPSPRRRRRRTKRNK